MQKTVLGVAESDYKLPVPRFKVMLATGYTSYSLSHSLQYDKFWQGVAPERDVFIMGLTDPAQQEVLRLTAAELGPLHGIKLHRHPRSKAFLGAATIMYAQAGCGKKAAGELDGKIVAGCYLRADLDDKGVTVLCLLA